MDSHTRKYLKERRAMGISDHQIIEELTSTGWTKEAAEQTVKGDSQDNHTEPKAPSTFMNLPGHYKSSADNSGKTSYSGSSAINDKSFIAPAKPGIIWLVQILLALDVVSTIVILLITFSGFDFSLMESTAILLTTVATLILITLEVLVIIGIQLRKKWAYGLTIFVISLSIIVNLLSFAIFGVVLNIAILVMLVKVKSYFYNVE